MSRFLFRGLFLCMAAVLMLAAVPAAWGQHTQGRINVTVLDPQGGVVPGAKLELKDPATAEVRTAETQSAGNYSFVNLPPGKYKLTVTMDGFQQVAFDVTVQATKTTDVEATLTIGAVTEVIEVGAVSPVVDTTTNTIGSVIDMKHIENLPITGRDITQLARLGAGYAGTPGANGGGTGSFNGLPSSSQGNNVDGVIGSSSRMKFGGNQQAAIQPRLENIEEMTVQIDQLDMNQGFGQSATQINFVTRRGSNDFHGRVYEDFRNRALNANSWSRNAVGSPKVPFILNDFGGSVGGPVLKDKLFFFFSLATARQPGSASVNRNFLNAAAQAGSFTYLVGATPTTVNLFTLAQNCNTTPASCNLAAAPGLPTAVNSVIGGELNRINQSLSSGSVATTSNRNVSNITFQAAQPNIYWFPTFRVDYNPFQRIRMNLAVNRTKRLQENVNTQFFPGSDFASTAGNNEFDAFTAAYGLEWTVSPTLINEFRLGYLYNTQRFVSNSPREFVNTPQIVNWPALSGTGLQSTMTYYLPVTTFYPVWNASDTLTWQKSAHTLSMGFSFYREQDHYWNPPEGIASIGLGIAALDPAFNAFSNANNPGGLPGATTTQEAEARALYALLTGRITGLSGRYPYDPASGQYQPIPGGAFNLNEVANAWGLFAQDSWRLRPSLTLNYGLRWDFTASTRDKNRAYHNADVSSVFGPSGVGFENLFNPGALPGNLNPTLEERKSVYNAWNATPQPSLGVAWAPQFQNGILQKLFGEDDTVIRAGASLRRFTVPYQYFWNNASNYGGFFYQFFQANAGNQFPEGSLSVGQPYPTLLLQPATYQAVASASQFTFNNNQFTNGINGMKQDIGQPYSVSWSFGIQRKLGESRALEIRYIGNRTENQWISINVNEVNVFENGFLVEFQRAKGNLDVCRANSAACIAAQAAAGVVAGSQTANSFANWGLTGQNIVPIMTAAFTGSNTGVQTNAGFRNGAFVNQLTNGEVGAFARTLTTATNSAPYFCNLVGPTFTPCVTNLLLANGMPAFTGTGAGYPINFFQANPYATGQAATLMTDIAYSNYNSLQIDFRQRAWHGMQFDANYTWSHTLGVSTPNDWTGAYTAFTLRDLRHSYSPALFDVRHAAHVAATVDLPFGKGRQFANSGGWLDRIVGGWSVGTIVTYQTGFPFRVTGGYQTFNNIADGGVNLTGVTRKQLQNAVGVYHVSGSTTTTYIDPQYLVGPTGGGANPAFITANTTPGVFNPPLILYGPHGFYDDISITKTIAITERWKFIFQSQFLNAFNHPVWGQGNPPPVGGNVRSSGWATTGGGPSNNFQSFGRQIEFRATIQF